MQVLLGFDDDEGWSLDPPCMTAVQGQKVKVTVTVNSDVSGEKKLSPVEMGPKNGGFGCNLFRVFYESK